MVLDASTSKAVLLPRLVVGLVSRTVVSVTFDPPLMTTVVGCPTVSVTCSVDVVVVTGTVEVVTGASVVVVVVWGASVVVVVVWGASVVVVVVGSVASSVAVVTGGGGKS